MLHLPFIALTSLATASAEPAMLQTAVFPEALVAATEFIQPQTFSFERRELSTSLGCWDSAGVKNLNFTVELEDVQVELVDGGVRVFVDLGYVGGTNMSLYAHDPKDGDLCNDIDATLRFIELYDGSVDVSVAASVDGTGGLDVAVLDGPILGGDLDMDLEWAPSWAQDWGWDLFPDDLFLSFLEDDIMQLAGEAGAAMIPELADELLTTTTFEAAIGKLSIAATLAELSASTEALAAGVDFDLDWAGRNGCAPQEGERRYVGRRPRIDLSQQGAAMLGVGVTEYMVNELGFQAWEDGLFCLNADDVDDLLLENLPDIEPGASAISASARLEAPPVLTFDEGLVGVDLEGIRLHLSGKQAGQKVEVLDLDADVFIELAVEMDPELAAVVISVAHMDFVVQDLDARHLLSDEPDAEAHFVDFLETWLPRMAQNRVDALPVGATVFKAMGYAIRLEDLAMADGGIAVPIALFSESDPEVDVLAPETHVELVDATATSLTIRMAAVDDQDDALAYRYRLDGGPWSNWSLDEEAVIDGIEPGEHLLEVESRDRWHNIDPSPTHDRFDLVEVQRALVSQSCAVGGVPPMWWLVCLSGVLLGRRRVSS